MPIFIFWATLPFTNTRAPGINSDISNSPNVNSLSAGVARNDTDAGGLFSQRSPGGKRYPAGKDFSAKTCKRFPAINRERGITSIFVGQVLNRARLQNTTRYGYFPLVRDVDIWPLQPRFNAILKETADEVGSPEFVPPIDAFQDSDFVDNGHFSPGGAEKFATMLEPLGAGQL